MRPSTRPCPRTSSRPRSSSASPREGRPTSRTACCRRCGSSSAAISRSSPEHERVALRRGRLLRGERRPRLQRRVAVPGMLSRRRKVLVVDVGGTHVKVLASGHREPREIASGPSMTASDMVAAVKRLAAGWRYDVVSIGYPGVVVHGRPVAEPYNLGRGWVGFDFRRAFGRPVRIINDAAMQALGSYRRGRMLFLGLGTGLGSAMVVEGVVVPFELGQLSYKKGTLEDYLGLRGLQRLGKKKWRQQVAYCIGRLVPALHLDDVVLGGGNVKKLKTLPEGCRGGDNVNAFLGGFRLWEDRRLRSARRKKALFVVRTKSSPRTNQKTRFTEKGTKGA